MAARAWSAARATSPSTRAATDASAGSAYVGAMPQIEFTRRFAMAHRLLSDPASKCVTPHGHNEFVTVTLAADTAPDWGASNMALSFERLKTRWHGWIDEAVDHALQLNARDPLVGFFREHEPERLPRLMLYEGDPTTEAAASAFARKLAAFLAEDAPGWRCVRLRLEETPTNAVVLEGEAAAGLGWSPGAWCDRADLSINDL